MHANIHLPEQVKLHGPLHKRNEYAGENCFKEMSSNYHGTTNIPLQIATNISIKNEIRRFLTPEEVAKIDKIKLKELVEKLHLRKISNQKCLFQIEPVLINPEAITFIEIATKHNLLNQYFDRDFLLNNQIYAGPKLYYKSLCK